ncbi:hypothetical protein ACIOHS_32120 [Streptomyces sp. NPDC088253]|uniref:hypothetical protein n=1 Tax=Streptomyces sp. NPDC088253 TaxID=3365846 RepID=UPI00382E88EC
MRSNGRSARIQALVAEQAARRGAGIGVVDVCTAAVAALPVGGARAARDVQDRRKPSAVQYRRHQ